MKTIYNPLMRLFDALILFIMSVGAFIFTVTKEKHQNKG